MKLVSVLKAMLVPHLYIRNRSEDFKRAFAVVSIVFILAYIAFVINTTGIVSGLFDEAIDIITESSDFSLKDNTFLYSGERYVRSIKTVDINVIADGNSDDAGTDSSAPITVFFGRTKAHIATPYFEYGLTYEEIRELAGESIDVTKTALVKDLPYAKSLVINTLVSVSVLLFFVLYIAFLIVMLIVGLIVLGTEKLFKTGLLSKNLFFITVGSFLYGALVSLVIFIIPGSLITVVENLFVLLRFKALLILVYLVFVFVPLIKSVNTKQQEVNTPQ